MLMGTQVLARGWGGGGPRGGGACRGGAAAGPSYMEGEGREKGGGMVVGGPSFATSFHGQHCSFACFVNITKARLDHLWAVGFSRI